MELRVNTAHFGTISVISAGGDVDDGWTESSRRFLVDVGLNEPTSIIIDLTGVDAVDPTGLAALATAKHHFDRSELEVILVVSPALRPAVLAAGLDRDLVITTSVDAARRRAAGSRPSRVPRVRPAVEPV